MILILTSLLPLLAVTAVDTALTVETACPFYLWFTAGRDYLSIYNDTCFFFATIHSAVYEEALKFCKLDGGNLAMPKTNLLNNYLIYEMRKREFYGPMWIGMHDKEDEGSWVWEDGTDAVTWNNTDYYNGGFFGGGEDCMALNSDDGLWHDHRCSRFALNAELPFICQYPVIVNTQKTDISGGNKTIDDIKVIDQNIDHVKDLLDNDDDFQAPGSVSDDDQGPGDVDDDDQGPGDVGDDDQGPGDVSDDDQGPGDVSDDDQATGDVSDDDQATGGMGDVDQATGDVGDDDQATGNVSGDDKGPGDVRDDDQGPGDVGDDDQATGDMLDNQDQGIVDDDCPPFVCPDLDCGMNGFLIENGCQKCECAS